MNGFQRSDVSRLVLTFGRLQGVAPVRLAIFLELRISAIVDARFSVIVDGVSS